MSETLTYEQMMALFAEGRKETAELRESIASLRTFMTERDARADERLTRMEASIDSLQESVSELRTEVSDLKVITEKNNARLDKAIAKLDDNTARLDKNNAKLDENNSNVGKLTNKLGGIIENAVLPDIVDKFKEKGFKFKKVSVRVEILNENETKHLAEIDALLENGKFVIAVEAKTDMQIKDVDAHIKRLEVLRKHSRFSGKKIYGALATAVVRKKPVDYALKHGFYVLQRPDIMGVKILDFPKGHSAKAW
jgi:chromosome segregation ATPase